MAIGSINIISLDTFAESIKSNYEAIPFNQIHKTELNAWTRYFSMDDINIYYRVKDFDSKIQCIYSINKKTLEKKLLKSIQMDNSKFSYSNNLIWYDMKNLKIYQIKIIDDRIKQVKEIFDEDFVYQYDELKEDFEGVINNYFITSFWTEDNNGDDFKSFVKIRDIKNKATDIYEGVCMIIKDTIILFK